VQQFTRPAHEGKAGGPVVIYDLEFHGLHNAPVCQITAVDLIADTRAPFNEYVFFKPLHPDWMQLVEKRGVSLAPWDDPARSRPWDQVLARFVQWCQPHSCLLSKGTIDLARMMQHLEQHFDSVTVVQPIHALIRQRDLHFASLDGAWKRLCKLLPPLVQEKVMSIAAVKPLGRVWDALFWHPVLVYIPQDLTHPETVAPIALDTRDVPLVLCEQHATTMEFSAHGHLAPIWHTAHTDALATLHITVFLMLYVQFRAQIRAQVQVWFEGYFRRNHALPDTYEHMELQLLSTSVVRHALWFRQGRCLVPTPEAIVWLYHTSRAEPNQYRQGGSVNLNLHMFDFSQRRQPLAAPPAAAPNFHNSQSIINQRGKRLQEALIPITDDRGREYAVYVPRSKGFDVCKVRALKSLVGMAIHPTSRGTVYDRLEQERTLSRPLATRIGNRPWYYFPKATGSLAPGVQVLHTRQCTDRRNGAQHGADDTYLNDNVAFYDFTRVDRVIGYELRFCKECRRFAEPGDAPTEVLTDATTPATKAHRTIPSSILILLCMTLCV
jgi:hypothetical protein